MVVVWRIRKREDSLSIGQPKIKIKKHLSLDTECKIIVLEMETTLFSCLCYLRVICFSPKQFSSLVKLQKAQYLYMETIQRDAIFFFYPLDL